MAVLTSMPKNTRMPYPVSQLLCPEELFVVSAAPCRITHVLGVAFVTVVGQDKSVGFVGQTLGNDLRRVRRLQGLIPLVCICASISIGDLLFSPLGAGNSPRPWILSPNSQRTGRQENPYAAGAAAISAFSILRSLFRCNTLQFYRAVSLRLGFMVYYPQSGPVKAMSPLLL